MAQALSTYFTDDIALFTAGTRVPGASFDTGMTYGASNSPGIGISTENPNLEEQLPNWTLLDQHGNARAGQLGQLIGGSGITATSDWPGSGGAEGTAPDAVIRMATNPANVNGQPDNDASLTNLGNATLTDLAVGWVVV